MVRFGGTGLVSRTVRTQHQSQSIASYPSPSSYPSPKNRYTPSQYQGTSSLNDPVTEADMVGTIGYGDENFTPDKLPLQESPQALETIPPVPQKVSDDISGKHDLYKFLFLILLCGGAIAITKKKVKKELNQEIPQNYTT